MILIGAYVTVTIGTIICLITTARFSNTDPIDNIQNNLLKVSVVDCRSGKLRLIKEINYAEY